ncbi:DUF2169 domain-containing protein [Psychrobacter urativorans]|uniref:DUF2169 domain-containing protein n=1 Tax=Psychrobacter urativorans TaxID=45610 RepID=UPI00191A6F72|nr:DUF2169 domain-containing protein [Psychrobacter urativorans]
MKFTNTTNHPALAFEGLDQLGQSFHVIVMRQTYTWNEQGLLVIADEQDPLRLEDQLTDTTDLMSGIVEESDLAHYKPKCDVIIKGHAYVPKHKQNQDSFTASIKLQTPDYKVLAEPVAATKYAFVAQSSKKPAKDRYQTGQILIDKTLTILSPRYLLNDSITGNSHYKLHIEPMPSKVSLNPSSSFGGYSLIEDRHNALNYIDKNELIPEDTRHAIKLNPHHGVIAYLQENSFNPAGTGYCSPLYYKYVQPQHIQLSQIHHSDLLISESIVNQVGKNKLDYERHNRLVAGFGVRAKSHPERVKLVGQIDENFIESGDAYPKGFDFAMWNSAYADQQTSLLTGNEWLTLTNLCKSDTVAATITRSGDTELKLYLPELLAYLALESKNAQTMVTELPLRLDTVIISPDKQKVNLVWRAIIIDNYEPRKAVLDVIEKATQDELSEQYYTQTTEIARPYEKG